MVNFMNRPHGARFSVQTKALDFTPKRGDIVTFTYDHLTNSSIPIDPVIHRIRTDVLWKDVVKNYFDQHPKAQKLSGMCIRSMHND